MPGLPSAWSLRPRGRHALAVTRSAARGLIAPVAARAAATRAGTHTSQDVTAWATGPWPRGVRDAGQIARLATSPCTKHKMVEWHCATTTRILRKRYYRLVRLELRWIATIARLARIPGPVGTRRTVCIHTRIDSTSTTLFNYYSVRKRITHYKCAMQIKCHFVCHQHHHRPHARHHGSRDAGPRRNIAPAAAASCVVQGQPHVRELDRAEISMRHAMRDDGIGSRQEQRSQTQLSHLSLTRSREALRAEGYR